MILNIDRFKAKLLSPISVINATFVVYGDGYLTDRQSRHIAR